jgi:hypothetical protein
MYSERNSGKFSVLQKNSFLYSLLWECGTTVLLRKPQYEVCLSKTCTRVQSEEGATTIRKLYHRQLDKCHIVAEVGFSHLQRIH